MVALKGPGVTVATFTPDFSARSADRTISSPCPCVSWLSCPGCRPASRQDTHANAHAAAIRIYRFMLISFEFLPLPRQNAVIHDARTPSRGARDARTQTAGGARRPLPPISGASERTKGSETSEIRPVRHAGSGEGMRNGQSGTRHRNGWRSGTASDGTKTSSCSQWAISCRCDSGAQASRWP